MKDKHIVIELLTKLDELEALIDKMMQENTILKQEIHHHMKANHEQAIMYEQQIREYRGSNK